MAKKQIAGPNVALGGDPSGLHSAVNKAEGDLKRYVTSAVATGKKARHALDPRGWFGQDGKTGGLMGSLSGKILAGAEKSGSGFVSRFASGMLGGVAKLGGIAGGAGGAGLIGGLLTGGVGLAGIAAVGTVVAGLTLGVIGMKLAVSGLASAFQSALSIVERMGSAVLGKMMEMRDVIENNAQNASTLRISTENLIALQNATEECGVENEVFSETLKTMSAQLGYAQMGLKKSQKIFKSLGLDYAALANMDPGDAFQIIGARIAQLPDGAQRIAAASKLFGATGSQLLRIMALFAKGPEALVSAANDAKTLGFAISELDSEKVIQMNAAWRDMGDAMSGVATQLLTQVAPYATAALQSVLDWIQGDGGIPAKMEAVATAAADAAQNLYGKAIVGYYKLKSTVLDIAASIVEAWDKVAAIMTGKGVIGGAIAGAVAGAKKGGVSGMLFGGVAGAVGGSKDSEATVAPHAAMVGDLRGKSAEAQKEADAAAKKNERGEYKDTVSNWMADALQNAEERANKDIETRAAFFGGGAGFDAPDEKDKGKKDAAFGTGSPLLKVLSIAKAVPEAAAPGAFDNANSNAWKQPNANVTAWNRGAEPSVAAAPAVSQGKMTSDQLLTKIATGIDKLVRSSEQQGRRPAAVPAMG